jgi:hypothetical protein
LSENGEKEGCDKAPEEENAYQRHDDALRLRHFVMRRRLRLIVRFGLRLRRRHRRVWPIRVIRSKHPHERNQQEGRKKQCHEKERRMLRAPSKFPRG